MRGAVMLFCSMLVATACQQEDAPPPPPVGGGPTSGATLPPVGGQDSAGDDSSTMAAPTDGTGDSTVGTTSTGDTSDASGTGPAVPLLTGLLLEGLADVAPVSCQVRLHPLGSIDPGSGLPIEVAFEVSVPFEAYPQPYAINSVPDGSIGAGDEVYVSAQCDVTGDGTPDNLGSYFPTIPLETVLLPANGIDMVLDDIF